MDKLKEQKYLFAHRLSEEKLKSAEQSLTHRLVFVAIIFVIFLIILVVQLEGASSGVQWLWFILFFGGAAVIVGLISNSYSCEKTEVNRNLNEEIDRITKQVQQG